MTKSERYSEEIVAAMKAANVFGAQERGLDIVFGVKLGAKTYRCELNFSEIPVEKRAAVTHACYRDALKQALAHDAAERAKVASCPTCRVWFISTKARNEHRAQCREDAQIETRSSP